MNKIFRTLLMTIVLVMGVVNVQAEEESIWTESSIYFTISADVFKKANTKVKDGTILRIYTTGQTSAQYGTFGATIWQSQMRWGSNGFLLTDDATLYDSNRGCFTLVMTADQATNILQYGISFNNDQDIRVTLEAGEGTGTGDDTPVTPVTTTHKLTYIVDGNTYKSYDVESGASITPEVNPLTVGYYKPGYKFEGWKDLPSTMPDNDVTTEAVFSVNKYIISYYINYQEGDEPYTTVEVDYGSTIEPITPSIEGYRFVRWDYCPETMPAQNIDVKGTAIQVYTLTLYYNSAQGSAVASKTKDLAANDQATVTVTPADGYEVESVDFNSSDNSPLNSWFNNGLYYVQFGSSNVTCNVTFNEVGAPETPTHALKIVVDGNEETKQVPEGAALSGYLPANPTKAGYTFNAWSNMPEGEVMPTEDWEVTATFTINTYHITYMVDGAQYGDVADVVYGADITAPAAPSKDGFTFTGWDNLPETMPADNLTINAQFTRNLTIGENETVIWDGTPAIVHGTEENLFIKNTNSWVSSTDQGGILRIYADINNPRNWKLWTGGGNWDHPTFVNVPNADLRESSTFTGYNATKVCFEFEFNDVTKQNLLNHITSDGTAMSISFWGLTIYKVTYEPPVNVPKHTLTFMMDDQQTVIETMQVAEGAEIPAITPPTKTGYVFRSWANMPLSGNMPASDLTLVAVFTEATYTLTFKIGDEVYGEPTQLAYGATITAPTDVPERTGYTFSGWQNVPETMPAQDLTIIGYYTKEKTYETLSVGTSKYNTFYSTQPLYFQGSESVKAFIAIQYSATEVKLRQVIGAVAANTPLVLKGDAANASANIEVVESGESYGNNLLVGVRQSTSINSPQKYVLVEKSGTVKFADTGNHAATVPANKAYLQAPAGANARQLTIIFEGGVTAIEAISTENDDVPAVFNLSGQQVKNPGKGLYIINGKKVIIK